MKVSPQSLGQVLGDTMASLARIWKGLAVPALAVFIPAGLANLWVFAETGAAELFEMILSEPTFTQTLPPDAVTDLLIPFYRAVGVMALINLTASVLVFLASHRLVAANIAGAGPRPSVAGTSRGFLAAFGALILALFGGLILVSLGLAVWQVPATLVGTPNATSQLIAGALLTVMLAPGVWFLVATSMVTPTVALEGKGVFAALRRSIDLVRGRWWPTFGYLLIVGLFGLVALQLIQLVAIPLLALGGMGLSVTAAAVVGIVAQGLIVASLGAAITWWYVDLRARSEPLVTEDLR